MEKQVKEITTLEARVILQRARAKAEQVQARSAWNKGILEYVADLFNEYQEKIEYHEKTGDANIPEFCEVVALNGAQDWAQYSEGGCSLVYNNDICDRLCNESEKKRTRNGLRNPNAHENWIDLQSRALRQAYRKAKSLWDLAAEELDYLACGFVAVRIPVMKVVRVTIMNQMTRKSIEVTGLHVRQNEEKLDKGHEVKVGVFSTMEEMLQQLGYLTMGSLSMGYTIKN